MSVYMIQVGTDGPIKIGRATYVWGRLQSLQTANPEKLRLVRVLFGGVDEEKTWHARFRDLRIRGEWFRYEGALKDFVLRVQHPTPTIGKSVGWAPASDPPRFYKAETLVFMAGDPEPLHMKGFHPRGVADELERVSALPWPDEDRS